MTTLRVEGYTATLLRDGRVLITGGIDENLQPLASAEVFDPQTCTFKPTGSMRVRRFDHAAALLSNGLVLVVGGHSCNFGCIEATAELYDPDTGTFTPTGSLSFGRSGHTETLLPHGPLKGRVLVAGGEGPFPGGPDNPQPKYSELYDPARGTFSITRDASINRLGPAAVLLLDGEVVLIGGVSVESLAPLNDAETFDPATLGFTKSAGYFPLDDVNACSEPAAVLIDRGSFRGQVLVVGSSGTSAELYDPVMETFAPTQHVMAASPYCRPIANATRLRDGQILVTGGALNHTAQLFDPQTAAFRGIGEPAVPGFLNVFFSTAILLRDGRVLITAGGISTEDSHFLSSAQLYEP